MAEVKRSVVNWISLQALCFLCQICAQFHLKQLQSVVSVCTINGGSAGVVPLASIVTSDLKAWKGGHYAFENGDVVEDKSVDDKYV